MNTNQKGTQVNHTTPSARTPFLRTGIFAALRGVFGGGEGSGAPSDGVGGSGAGFFGVTGVLRVAGLVALTIVVLALTSAPASAALKNEKIGEITGAFTSSLPTVGMLAVDDHNGHIFVADSAGNRIRDYASASDQTPTEWTSANLPAGDQFLGTLSVAADNATGDVYVADSSTALIYKFDQGGNLIGTFGDHETLGAADPDGTLAGLKTPAGSFAPPSSGFGIAIDQATGDLYAIDAGHQIVNVFGPKAPTSNRSAPNRQPWLRRRRNQRHRDQRRFRRAAPLYHLCRRE